MRTDLLKRVERIESRFNPGEGITAIFRNIVSPDGTDRPVSGWSFRKGAEQVQVLRQEGETDESLAQRAETLARAHVERGGIPRLISLN